MTASKGLKIIREEGDSCSSQIALNIAPDKTVVEPRSYRGNAAIVTLGCAKNQVDSEVMLGVLRTNGFNIVSDLKLADVAIVNTCGFLQSSVKESIDSILSVAEQKKSGRLRKLLVAGCLVERYKADLKQSLPEVDDFVLVDDILKVNSIVDGESHSLLTSAARPYFLYDDTMPRQVSTQRHTAYVKVSEGCNRPCTFCIIPKLRGAMRSRTIDSIVKEVGMLGEQGVREVNLVAQDLTSFGGDRKDETLTDLITRLDKQGAVDWIRLLYSYPIGIDDKLLSTIVAAPRVCNYLDLPLQHSSEVVLKAMKRPVGRYSPRSIIEFIRKQQPQIHLRTTFIVGFPGETEQDVDDLEAFIAEGHFTNVGIFTYSKEEGTQSYDLSGHLPEKVKNDRRKRLMLAQQKVNNARCESYIGKSFEVLLEGTHEETDLLFTGRTRFQAPDVDGLVIVNDVANGLENSLQPGALVSVEITETAGYDLIGRVTSTIS